MNHFVRSLVLFVLTLGVGSCALLARGPEFSSDEIDRSNATRAIELARADIEGGDPIRGVERLAAVRGSAHLTPEQLHDAEVLLDSTVRELLGLDETGQRIAEPKLDAGDLKHLFKLEIGTNLRASAGLLSAQALFRSGHPVKAYKRIRAVDKKLPDHAARPLGGSILAEIGLSLIHTPGNYYLIFSYAKRGVVALEYLVVNYPLAPECAEAYVELSKYYEEEKDYDYAIERLEDLLLYHPTSPYTVAAEAHLPYLRLQRLRRDDYDRSQILLAVREIDQWLLRHPGHELEPTVKKLRARAQRRLARSDLILSRYYRKVNSPLGARLHAERSLAEAESAGAEEEAEEARALLAELPPREDGAAPGPAPTTQEPVGPVLEHGAHSGGGGR
ncbi:MAG TPA: outer membrane protein assembly factor BamD [Planctomycetes bacterium]|nr:outer membrane protein assembly factor BamD [Planctomycetota bacterium]